MITETLQGPLIVLMSLLLLPFGLYQVGGIPCAARGASQIDVRFHVGVAGIYAEVGDRIEFDGADRVGVQPGIVAAVGSGKTELEGRVGYTYGTMIKRFSARWVGFSRALFWQRWRAQHQLSANEVQSLEGKGRELAFGMAIQRFFRPGMIGLVFAAIFASQMATICADANLSGWTFAGSFRVIFPEGRDV